MKIALISDIHGNLPALEAVMADIKSRSVDKIICLGDIVGKGPNSKETVDLCRKECIHILIGNWEAGLCKDYETIKSGNTEGVGKKNLWYVERIGGERMEYLAALPHSCEFYLSGKLVRLFHAHPKSFARYFNDSPLEKRLELFGCAEDSTIEKEADIAIYADIHTVYMQRIEDRLLLNIGSVGNPLDMTLASYVILEGDEGSTQISSFNIAFQRVPYDIDRAVRLARESSGLPDIEGYIGEITTAKYFRRGN